MSNNFDHYLGTKDESVYGTAVAVDKFYEFNSESVAGVYERLESEGLRPAKRFLRSDRYVPYAHGAAGEVEMEVQTKGFGFWLKHIFGGVSTGATASGVTPHTFTPGALDGKSFTLQVGRVGTGGTLTPFTYEGGKVVEWSLENSVDELLKLTVTCDFEKETTTGAGAYAAQTPSMPTENKLFSFVGGAVTIAAAAVSVKSVTLNGTNGQKDDRWFFGNSKKEQLEDVMREINFEIEVEYESMTQYNRIAAATPGAAEAAIVLTWNALETVGGGGQPSLVVTIPVGRFDAGPVNLEGELPTQTITGKAIDNGTDPVVTVVYTSPDATI